MSHSKTRRIVGALFGVLALAVCALVPSTPARAEGANGPDGTLYVVENCAVCGGDHTGDTWTRGLGLFVPLGNDSDWVNLTIENSNPAVVRAERMGDNLTVTALAPGEAHLVITADNATTIPAELDFEVKSVSDPAELPAGYSTASISRYAINMNDPYGGLSNCWITSDKIMEQSVLDTIAENNTGFELGESVRLGNGQNYAFMGWQHDGYYMDLSSVPSADAFSSVSAFFQDGVLTHYYDCPIKANWNPDPSTGVYEPWAPGAGATLLPYTLKDGILTFDGVPGLGEWYQLDIECGDGVSYNGTIAGGASKTMTIERALLHEDDPLFDPNGYTSAPVWIRGDAGEDRSSLAFVIPEGEGVDYRLEPADAGRLYTHYAGDGVLYLGVQLDKPATLVVEKSDTVTVSNSDGATMTAPVSTENPYYYNNLTLVTQHIGKEPAQAATNAVVAAVDGVTGHPYVFDIHLLDQTQKVVQPLDGDSVTITMPIPEGLSAEGLHVFHVADDGTVTDMGATVDAEAGTVSFTTTHFSTFVLANVTVETGHSGGQGTPVKPAGVQGESGQAEGESRGEGIPATGDPAAVASLLTAGLGAIALLGGRAIRRRR